MSLETHESPLSIERSHAAPSHGAQQAEHGAEVPFTVFTTDLWKRADDRFEAWRESIDVIFDVRPHGGRVPEGFAASVRAYNLGEMLVAGVDFSGQHFERKTARIASDGIDHYLVQLYVTGGLEGEANRSGFHVRSRDVEILDLGKPHSSNTLTSTTIAIVVPRDLMLEMLPAFANVHGLVLPGDRGLGSLLADFLRSLARRMNSIAADEAPIVARATAEMIAASFYPTSSNAARARVQTEGVLLDRLKRYVGDNLGSAELTPDSLCRRFRISRSQLYRIFEPLGGVARYIQRRRLQKAFAQLRDPLHRHRRISEIAFEAGFSSEAHFSRAFRQEFEMAPSDARFESGPRTTFRTPSELSGQRDDGYEDWLRRLSRRR